MNKRMLAMIALAACLTIGVAPALADMAAHDLSGGGYGTNEICIFCHTPHNAPSATMGPLWNHDVTIASYTVYGGTVAGDPGATSSGTVVGQPGDKSKVCLSCHDGTVGIGAFGGATNTTYITGDALVGTDLTDDHPVGVDYGGTGKGLKSAPATAVLYGNKVECASCHLVHDNTNAPFLRMSNAASALCLDCHDK